MPDEPADVYLESQRLYQASLESSERREEAYLKALAESNAANLRAAVALERIAAALEFRNLTAR